DQNRPLRRYRVERPERNAAAEAVEEAHSREARLADLRCANEIEIADARRLLGGALMPFDDAQPSAPLAEEIPDDAPAMAKMTLGFRVRQKGGGFKMRIVRRDPVDERPKRANVRR